MINNKIIKKNLSETKIRFNKNSHQLIQSYVNKNFSIIPSNTLLPQDWVNSDGFLMTMPYETGSDGLFGAVLQKK